MSMLSMTGRMAFLVGAEAVDSFMIKPCLKYHLFGQEVYLTTTHVSLVIVTILIMILAVCASRKMKNPDEIPGTFQNIIELVVEMLDNMVKGIMGENARRFVGPTARSTSRKASGAA